MSANEITPKQYGTRLMVGIPPREVTLGQLLPEGVLVQSAVIRIDNKDAVRVSCEYIVKEKP